MNEKLQNMSNSELKAYIKANRNDEQRCHEALKIILSRQTSNVQKYPYDLPDAEMEGIFREKLESRKHH